MNPPQARPTPGNLKPRDRKVKPANLRGIEETIVVLLANAEQWFVVDEFEGSTGIASATRNALDRRGFDVVTRQHPDEVGVVQVWARWTHEVPTEVAP